MYSTRKEWIEDLRGRIWEYSTSESDKLLSILLEIFENMPSEDAEILLSERDVYFVLPIANSVKLLYNSGEKYDWIVMLRTDLIDSSKDCFIYTVAHELAHVFLEHNTITDKNKPEGELDADRLVIKWGFEKELRASPDNYLYGDGAYQKSIRESVEKLKNLIRNEQHLS